MPIQAQPPQQPPVINPAPVQQVPVYIPVPSGQPSSNEVNNSTPSNSSSVSEAENISSNAANLNAYQVNSNHESTYFGYANRVTVPGTSIYGDLSAINDGWNWNRTNVVASVGIRHTFGGTAKNLALDSVRKDNLSKTLSVCDALGVFNGKVDINYEMMPQLQDCQYISQKVVVQQSPTNELKLIRQELEQYKLLIQQQKQDINYYQQKIEREYEYGSSVRVGG